MAESCAIDKRAIESLGDALAGSGRPLIAASGVALLAPGSVATEETVRAPGAHALPRVSEEAALATETLGVKGMAVRLAPTVHGAGDHGFVPLLIGIAREKGVAAYVGEGLNRWPAVHRLDAARAFRLALEKGVSGKRYHGVAEEGVPFKEIAAVIGKRLGLPVVSVPPEKAAEHFGWFAMFAGLDAPSSSALTREWLGWRPEGARPDRRPRPAALFRRLTTSGRAAAVRPGHCPVTARSTLCPASPSARPVVLTPF